MIKKISLILLLIFININTKALENTIDLNKKGSINITLKESGKNIDNAKITIYHIGDIFIKDNNIEINKKKELNCDIDLSNYDNILINKINNCINDNVIKYEGITKNGIVRFTNLDLGLYLVSQKESVEGYSNIDSFLVMIPSLENNNWIYDIDASPKVNIYELIDLVIKKEWNTISKNIPKYVEVELYKENILIDTIKLNEYDNWTYTFKNIEKSDKYKVKEINIKEGFTPSYKINDNVFTITNSDVLANTGKIFYPIIITFLIGITFLIFGIKKIKEDK